MNLQLVTQDVSRIHAEYSGRKIVVGKLLEIMEYTVGTLENYGKCIFPLKTGEVPKFREIGPHHEWVASSHAPISKPLKNTWHENQKQKKWLLKNHPEAALGNGVLGELLAFEKSYRHGQTPSWDQTQFAIGEMTDLSDPRNIVGMPLLAMAAGSAGNELRLLQPKTDLGIWHVGEDDNLMLKLLDHSGYQETSWTRDIGTIRRVRPVVSTRRFEPVRWLIVLRDFGSTIFRPEYRKVPVQAQTLSENYPQTPSHIAPNPLFTLTKSQTGYESQSDVAFNVGIKSKPPQLAFVDEGGNWSVWDITGIRHRTYKRPKPRLSQCGDIRKGSQPKLSRRPAPQPQWHRILWVGHSNPEHQYDAFDDEEDSVFQRSSLFPPLERSSTLLICNQKTLRLLDLDTNTFLPDLRFVADNSHDVILDVQADSQDPRYFYVVTTSRLFVAAQLSSRDVMQIQIVKKSLILHSFPHFRAEMDKKLKIAMTPGPSSAGKRTSLVFLYSQKSSWYDVFCITFSKDHSEHILCYHDTVVTKSPLDVNEGRSLQTLYPSPVLTTAPPDSMVTDEARLFPGHQTRFFQLFSFGTDLSLSDCLGASLSLQWNHNVPSIERLSTPEQSGLKSGKCSGYRRKSDKFSSQELERKRAVRYLSSRFVVADRFAESRQGNAGLTISKDASTSITVRQPLRRMIQPIYDILYHALQDLGMGRDLSSVEMEIYGAAPLDPIYVALQTALETKDLPLRTLFEIVGSLRIPGDIHETSEEWQTEIAQLSLVDPAVEIRSLIPPNNGLPNSPSLQSLFLDLGSVVAGVHQHDVNFGSEFVHLAMRQIAGELYLSRLGIAYLPASITERQLPASLDALSSTQFSDDMLVDGRESHRSTALSPSLPPSMSLDGQASSRASTPASTAPSTIAKSDTGDGTEDWSIALVRTLTGSGKILHKCSEILSMWGEGEDPVNHVFTVDKDTEITPGMRRRAKQEARDARKRKRAETLLQLQRGHILMPLTQPVPETRFPSQASQPLSEFSQARIIPSPAAVVTMSQPVPGAFGGRSGFERPRKKAKRKGGF